MRSSILIICVWLLGCGDGGSGQCGAFTPCGGAIVGTWSITGYCSNLTNSSSYCTGMSVSTQVQMSGTFNFTSTGTYSIASMATGTMNMTVPQSCLNGLTCAQVGSSMSQGSGGASGSCMSTTNGNCSCSESIVNSPGSEQGTYSTSGSSLTMIKTGGSTSEDSTQYCVQGDTLMIQATSPTASGATTVVAIRQ